MRPLKLVIPVLAIIVSALVVIAQSNSSDAPPVISAVAPVYPPIARQARATSDTTVQVEIDREGKVTSVESNRGGHPLFRKVAEEAARRWVVSAVSFAYSTASPANAPDPVSRSGKTTQIKVYLIAGGDNGKNGKKIGCDDSLVAVTRTIQPTAAPLRAALDELLSMPEEFDNGGQKLGNYWKGSDLKVKNVSLARGTATIQITGRLLVAGICDEPRITEQIEATAKQFPNVKRVRVFVNGTPLKEAIS